MPQEQELKPSQLKTEGNILTWTGFPQEKEKLTKLNRKYKNTGTIDLSIPEVPTSVPLKTNNRENRSNKVSEDNTLISSSLATRTTVSK